MRVLGEARQPKDFAKLPFTSTPERPGQSASATSPSSRTAWKTAAAWPGSTVSPASASASCEPPEPTSSKSATRSKARFRTEAKLPGDLALSISTDFSLFIKDDIAEVKETLLIGIVLTAVVTFCFLGSIGTTLNVCLSIPISLIGTFMVIRYLGFTVNFMTLLGLSLSVGVVVDDAILVLENIYRLREQQRRQADESAEEANRYELPGSVPVKSPSPPPLPPSPSQPSSSPWHSWKEPSERFSTSSPSRSP